MILYQMKVIGEAKPIKVNNPATIHGANELIVKESAAGLGIIRQKAMTIIRAQGNCYQVCFFKSADVKYPNCAIVRKKFLKLS